MSDNKNSNGDDSKNQGGEGQSAQDRNWRQLEDAKKQAEQALEAVTAERNKLFSVALESVAARAGFDPTDGVTKLLIDRYANEGADLERLSAESFSTFAQELNIQPPPPPNQGGQGNQQGQQSQPGAQPGQQQAQPGQQQASPPGLNGSTPNQAVNEFAQQLQGLQQQSNELTRAGQMQPSPPSRDDHAAQAARAEAEGRWTDTFAHKAEMI